MFYAQSRAKGQLSGRNTMYCYQKPNSDTLFMTHFIVYDQNSWGGGPAQWSQPGGKVETAIIGPPP